jgi:hypothetical protein
MGQVNVVRIGSGISASAAHLLTSGILGRSPVPHCRALAQLNGALESFVKGGSHRTS